MFANYFKKSFIVDTKYRRTENPRKNLGQTPKKNLGQTPRKILSKFRGKILSENLGPREKILEKHIHFKIKND